MKKFCYNEKDNYNQYQTIILQDYDISYHHKLLGILFLLILINKKSLVSFTFVSGIQS